MLLTAVSVRVPKHEEGWHTRKTGRGHRKVCRTCPPPSYARFPIPSQPFASCAALCNTFEFSEFSSQAARLGTLPTHLQVQRGQHRLRRLVYTDPQEMLSLHSPSTAMRAGLLPLTTLMGLCGIQEKRRFRKDINLSSAI